MTSLFRVSAGGQKPPGISRVRHPPQADGPLLSRGGKRAPSLSAGRYPPASFRASFGLCPGKLRASTKVSGPAFAIGIHPPMIGETIVGVRRGFGHRAFHFLPGHRAAKGNDSPSRGGKNTSRLGRGPSAGNAIAAGRVHQLPREPASVLTDQDRRPTPSVFVAPRRVFERFNHHDSLEIPRCPAACIVCRATRLGPHPGGKAPFIPGPGGGRKQSASPRDRQTEGPARQKGRQPKTENAGKESLGRGRPSRE